MTAMTGDIDLDFWIARGMARRMGVNLSDAMFEGMLTRADFAQMVERCHSCPRSHACLAYLANPVGEDPAVSGTLPCDNAAAMMALRRRLTLH